MRSDLFAPLLFFIFSFYSSYKNEDIVIEEDDHSFVLTDSNWDHAHKLYEYILVFFYRPDCDQCMLSDEVFVYAARHAKEVSHDVKFGFVNVSRERTIAHSEEIESVPVIRFYRNKTGVNYLRTIGKHEIIEWLNDRIKYELKSISSFEDLKSVLINNPLAVIGCILSNSMEDIKDFEIVASMHDDVEFRLVKDAEICQKLNLPTFENSVGIYQYDFNIQHSVSGKLSRKIINDFIIKHHVPIYSELSEFIFTKSFVGHYHYFVPIIFKVFPIPLNQIKAEIRSVAQELDGKVIFIHFDISKAKVRKFLEHLSVPENEGFRVVESNKHLVNFKPEDPLNLNGSYMLSFIKRVMDGSVEPELMGSDPKEDWHKERIKHLTRKTYDQVVMDKNKNVFVIIYSPECKFSREMLTVFDKLAEIYTEDSDVVLAKLDSTTDQLPRIQVQSTPIMFLYLKDNNEQIRFRGERTIENIQNFIKSNGKEGNEPQYLDVSHLQHARMTERGLVHEEL